MTPTIVTQLCSSEFCCNDATWVIRWHERTLYACDEHKQVAQESAAENSFTVSFERLPEGGPQ